MSSSPFSSYRALLCKPHVALFFALAMFARLSYATVGFASLLTLQRATNSYAVAGGGLVAYGLASALLAPARARLVDLYGPIRALPPLALVSASLFCVVALAAKQAADTPSLLVALMGLSGCFLPPLGPATRRVWADVADHPGELRAAYSLDTVAEEGLFTVGPLLVGLVVAVASPRASLLLTALLMLVGAVGMTQSPLMKSAKVSVASDAASASPAVQASPLRARPFALLLLTMFAAGAGLGGLELAAVAYSDSVGGAAEAGAVLATISLASAFGGVIYGLRAWTGTAAQHVALCCLALGAGLGLLALATRSHSLAAFATTAFFMGLFIAPLIVAAYTRADDLSTPASRTQASTLVSTLNNLGTSAGTAATGVLVETAGPGIALLAGGAVMLAAGGLTARLRRQNLPRAALALSSD